MREFIDSREAFVAAEEEAYQIAIEPDEYTEWQDVYGGDDWVHCQYDEY